MKKTKTSTAVKQRYNSKTYKQIKFELLPERIENFREACEATGTSMRSVIDNYMRTYAEEYQKNKHGDHAD